MKSSGQPSVPIPTTLIASTMAAINERIAARTLTPGSRLPSIREFAQQLGVSKSTIVEAYERLRSAGIIQSRPGAGYYVSAPLAPLSLAKTEPCLERDIDPLWITRQSLDAAHDALKPGCGWMPPCWMPEASVRRALRKIARSSNTALADYAPAKGLMQLRELLADRLANISVQTAAEHILLAESGTQAIDLLCRCLLEAGDTVLVDDPCYFNFHALLKAHGVHVISVPYTATGPDIQQFEQALKTKQPRLYITNSGVHNPTGATLSESTAWQIIKLAEQYDLRIVEDDIFADFEQTPAVRLAALDRLQRVCLIGSFSKTISASFRCGFIAAPADWVEQLLDLKIATSFGSGNLAARTTFAVLTDPAYARYVHDLRERLSDQSIQVAHRLSKLSIQPWVEPQAGLYLWCRLPEGCDAAEVARAALKKQVVLAPGNAFSLSQDFSEFMRFNVTQTHDEAVYRVLETVLMNAPPSPRSRRSTSIG